MILHDLTDLYKQEEIENLSSHEIVLATKKHQNCLGCFNCWVNNPGECIIQDSFFDISKKLISSNHIYIISSCHYGGFSPAIKSVIDRCIPNSLPSFYRKHGRIYHKPRYRKVPLISFIFYGNISKEEKVLAKKIVKAVCDNFHLKLAHSAFCCEENTVKKLSEIMNQYEGKE